LDNGCGTCAAWRAVDIQSASIKTFLGCEYGGQFGVYDAMVFDVHIGVEFRIVV
jgi:hypothetical protein